MANGVTGRRISVPRYRFACLWDKLNRKRVFGWDANPWVWVVEFRKVANG